MLRANRDLVACPSERVFQQIGGHLVEILLLACNRQIGRHALVSGNSFVRVDFSQPNDDVGNARRDRCLRARRPPQGRGARPTEVMMDTPLHQYHQGMQFARRIAAAFR